MRLTLTVVDQVRDVRADVVLEADPATPVAVVTRTLAAQVRPASMLPPPVTVPTRSGQARTPPVAALGGDGGFAPMRRLAPDPRPPRPRGFGQSRSTAANANANTTPTTPSEIVAFVGGRRLDPAATLAEAPLIEGGVVSLDTPEGCLPAEPPGLVELRVTSGPGAGVVHRLPAGEYTVGSDPGCAVQLVDPVAPAVALGLRVEVDGTTTLLPQPDADVLIDGERLAGARPAQPGEAVAVGAVLLDVVRPRRPDAAVRPSDDGCGLDVNRPPRLLPPVRETQYRLPAEPTEPDKRPLPLLMMLLPAMAGVTMAVVLSAYYFLLFALLSPLTMLGSYFTGNKQSRRNYRRQLADYRRRHDEVTTDAREALVVERAARRTDHPDPAAVLMTALGPRQRLWERRRDDPDYLHLRLGTADLPSEVVLEDPAELDHRRETHWTAPDVPVTVDLATRGVLGVAGSGELPQVLGCWLVAQAAVLHSPRDLIICVLTGSAGERAWSWVRWLPHCRPTEGQDTVVLLGVDDASRARRTGELVALISARAAARSTPGVTAPAFDEPDVLVVLDGARALRTLPGMLSVLRDGPAVGVRSVCLDRDVRYLPEECQALAEQTPLGLRVAQDRSDVVDDVRPDLVGTVATLSAERVGERAGERVGERVGVSGPGGYSGGGYSAGGYSAGGSAGEEPVTVDGAAAWCERLARALSPLRDVGDDDEATIPSSARLLDVLGIEDPSATGINVRWSIQPESTTFPIGVSLDGPFSIDLRRDGPHGLIAGTTGSGKSELLQSIVASLAVMNRPDAMTFVLVDYKGGSAFADCVSLPHTVGMVTDLDTRLVSRALTSLGAELRRREHILAEAGAKDIEDYGLLVQRSAAAGPALGPAPGAAPPPAPGAALRSASPRLAPLPRLLLVIDEFASLARELPDFVSGLVNIAQRGRSLGIHLLLATQRPSGVVSPEIRANTNLRVALRVTDVVESADVINAPDAARISKSTPGRAYARLGHTSLVPFQAGRVGGRRPGSDAGTRGSEAASDGSSDAASAAFPPPWASELSWRGLGGPPPRPPRSTSSDSEITDLKVLVEAIRRASADNQIPAQHSPWLPPLPDLLTLSDLLARSDTLASHKGGSGSVAPVLVGLSDHCDQQAQLPYAINVAGGSHLMIVGAPRSGRSTMLRTFAASLASTIPSSDVHLYVLDCGNNALAPLAGLPHTGAVVTRDSAERVQRLFRRLIGEIAARQERFAARGYADLAEQREAEPSDALPFLVLLLDRLEGFLASFENIDGGILLENLLRLLREGPAVGLTVLLTTDRRGLSGRLTSAIEDRFVLRMAEKAEYAIAGIPNREAPDDLAPGRGLRVEGVVETQIAVLDTDSSGRAQVAALHEIAARAAVRDGVAAGPATGPRTDPRRPFRIDVLPKRASVSEAMAMRPASMASRPMTALVGVGQDELTAIEIDLASDGPGFVIAGPPRSGRSSTLVTMARSLLDRGTRVVLVTARQSPLSALADAPGVAGVLDATSGSLTIDRLLGSISEEGPLAVVMDDAELLNDAPVTSKLQDFLRTARDSGSALIAAGTTEDLTGQFRGLMVDARRSRCGLILAPSASAEGELFGVRLSRAVGGTVPPGRGLFFLRGATTPIQVAYSE